MGGRAGRERRDNLESWEYGGYYRMLILRLRSTTTVHKEENLRETTLTLKTIPCGKKHECSPPATAARPYEFRRDPCMGI